MATTDLDTDGSMSIKIPRFNGRRDDDYGLWRHRLRAACRSKGVWGVVSPPLTTTDTTATGLESTPEASALVLSKREKASGIIICALGDAPSRVVLDADDDPARMVQLLDARYASNRTVSRISVQTQLFRMSYRGQDMSTYIEHYTALFSQLERMGADAAIPEMHKAPMLLASIDPTCPLESTAAALRTKEVSELTWDYVATTLIDEYNAKQSNITSSESRRQRWRKKKKGANVPSHTSQTMNEETDTTDMDPAARAFTVALKSMKNNGNTRYHCSFCDRAGHSAERCFINPDNPNNRLDPKGRALLMTRVKRKTSATDNSEKKVEIAGAILQKSTISPPKDHKSYADSGATGHFFNSKASFIPGTLHKCDTTTVLLADRTPVSSDQCRDVIIPFKNANIRLKNTFLVPGLGYNLVSTLPTT